MTKINKILGVFLQGINDHQRFQPHILELFDAITSGNYPIQIDKDRITNDLQTILIVSNKVSRSEVNQDEEFWYAYVRVLETCAAEIYRYTRSHKSEILNTHLSSLWQIARTLMTIYSEFTKNDLALRRHAEYMSFSGEITSARDMPSLDPNKETEVHKALCKEFLMVPHVSYSGQEAINDGFLVLEINGQNLNPGNKIPLPQSTTITAKPKGLNFPITILSSQRVHPHNFDGLVEAIRVWRPAMKRKYEEGPKAELAEYLRQKFLQTREEKGDSNTDVLVFANIPVEVKNKPTKSELHRLSGQILEQKKEYGSVIAVVVNITNNDVFEDWKETFASDPCVKIIPK